MSVSKKSEHGRSPPPSRISSPSRQTSLSRRPGCPRVMCFRANRQHEQSHPFPSIGCLQKGNEFHGLNDALIDRQIEQTDLYERFPFPKSIVERIEQRRWGSELITPIHAVSSEAPQSRLNTPAMRHAAMILFTSALLWKYFYYLRLFVNPVSFSSSSDARQHLHLSYSRGCRQVQQRSTDLPISCARERERERASCHARSLLPAQASQPKPRLPSARPPQVTYFPSTSSPTALYFLTKISTSITSFLRLLQGTLYGPSDGRDLASST